MKYLKSLVMMQLKDKMDFSFVKSRKALIAKIVFSILKFVAVIAVAYLIFMVCSILRIFSLVGLIPNSVMSIVLTLMVVLSLLSCTVGLTKTLYLADDNKVLITFPVNGNMIFLSKLLVFFVYELKRSLMITIPLFLAFGLINRVSLVLYLWLIPTFFLISALPVIVGALLSIPSLFIARFIKKIPFLGVALFIAVAAALVYGLARLIGIIPENINIITSWGRYYWELQDFLNAFSEKIKPCTYLVEMVMGRQTGMAFRLTASSFISFGVLFLSLGILLGLVYLLARPLFFIMMSKSFEFDKKLISRTNPNRKSPKFLTYLFKELKLTVRNNDTAYNLIAVYLAVPLMILLLNKILGAMDTRLAGQYMVYAFNILLIMLPLLASNSIIATLYSREGRVAYLKKTEPTNPLLPLITKLIPILLLSAGSVVASVIVFNGFVKFETGNMLLILFGLIGVLWGHILWSALFDLMNPQNEQYATTGDEISNPNEAKSTLSAFIISALLALFAHKLFTEGLNTACIKICLIGIAFAIIFVVLFIMKIKVYYKEK